MTMPATGASAQTGQTPGTNEGGATGGTTASTPNQSGTGQAQQGTGQAQATPAQQAATVPAMLSQEAVNALIGSRLAEARTSWENDAKATAERKEAEAKGEWEKVATTERTRAEKAEAEVATLKRSILVRDIAAKHNLPAEMHARLVGDTPEALEADAANLAKLIKAPVAPSTEGGAGSSSATDPKLSNMPIERPQQSGQAQGGQQAATGAQQQPATRYAWQTERDVSWPSR